ncbi:MAG: hypothetical protein IJQ62_03460 [Clostridia bacterium]|nr:hypothetical protein [Clostridia bacterium]
MNGLFQPFQHCQVFFPLKRFLFCFGLFQQLRRARHMQKSFDVPQHTKANIISRFGCFNPFFQLPQVFLIFFLLQPRFLFPRRRQRPVSRFAADEGSVDLLQIFDDLIQPPDFGGQPDLVFQIPDFFQLLAAYAFKPLRDVGVIAQQYQQAKRLLRRFRGHSLVVKRLFPIERFRL